MQYSSCQNVIAASLVHERSQLNDFDRCCRVHFETWCNRCSVSVKVTISHLGSLHFGSVLFSLRFPNGSFEMHSKLGRASTATRKGRGVAASALHPPIGLIAWSEEDRPLERPPSPGLVKTSSSPSLMGLRRRLWSRSPPPIPAGARRARRRRPRPRL